MPTDYEEIRGRIVEAWTRAANGQVAAAPSSTPMNCRRLLAAIRLIYPFAISTAATAVIARAAARLGRRATAILFRVGCRHFRDRQL